MKMVKSLILGSAAGLLAVGGAQAADLPVKAKAVEYVRICSLYGAGFWYIPGTDTCIRISGYFRAELDINANPGLQPAYGGSLGNEDRYSDKYTAQARGSLTFDTRTATEYGVVRGLLKMNETFITSGTSMAPQSAQFAAALSGPQGNEYGRGGGITSVDYAFVQFAGFTFGKAVSAFETPWFGQPANGAAFLIGGSDDVTGIPQIAYTAQFGNGVSGTIAIEDGTVYRRGLLVNANSGSTITATQIMGSSGVQTALSPSTLLALGITPFTSAAMTANGCLFANGGTTAEPILSSGTASVQCSNAVTGWGNSYGGAVAPDVTGNIRFDSAFLTAQIAGAAHLVNAGYSSTTLSADPQGSASLAGGGLGSLNGAAQGHPDAKWGGAVQGGVQFKSLPTGAGDLLTLEAIYAKGASAYVVSGTNPTSFTMFGTAKSGNSLGSIAFANVTDGVFAGPSSTGAVVASGALVSPGALQTQFLATGGSIDLTQAWAFRGGFTHYWTPQWQTSIYGSWTQFNYDNTAKTDICNALAVRMPGTTSVLAPGGAGQPGIGAVRSTSIVPGGGLNGAALAGVAGGAAANTTGNSTAGPSTGYSCNPDWGIAQVGGRIAWTPVKNLTFSTEVVWTTLMQKMSGQAYINPGATTSRNSGNYDFANQQTFGGFFRAERQF